MTSPSFPVPALPVLAAEGVGALVHVGAVAAGVVQSVALIADAPKTNVGSRYIEKQQVS